MHEPGSHLLLTLSHREYMCTVEYCYSLESHMMNIVGIGKTRHHIVHPMPGEYALNVKESNIHDNIN